MLEEAKNTAVKHLQQEQYDARQVEQAYSEKRRKALSAVRESETGQGD